MDIDRTKAKSLGAFVAAFRVARVASGLILLAAAVIALAKRLCGSRARHR